MWRSRSSVTRRTVSAGDCGDLLANFADYRTAGTAGNAARKVVSWQFEFAIRRFLPEFWEAGAPGLACETPRLQRPGDSAAAEEMLEVSQALS